MMNGRWAMIGVVLLGCAAAPWPARTTRYSPPQEPAAETRYAPPPAPSPYRVGLWTIRKRYVENVVSPRCGGAESPPSTQEVTETDLWPSHPLRAGHIYQQPCGLIANEMNTPGYRARFVEYLCAKSADPSRPDQACAAKFQQTFIARLIERYWAADFERVNSRCRAHPIECANLQTLERWAIESQNAAVSEQARLETQAAFQRAQSADDASAHARLRELEYAREQTRRRQERDAQALDAIAEALKSTPKGGAACNPGEGCCGAACGSLDDW